MAGAPWSDGGRGERSYSAWPAYRSSDSGGMRARATTLRRRALFACATSDSFERLVRATPAGERRAFERARRYVAGIHRDDALSTVERLGRAGIGSAVDFFGEDVRDTGTAASVANDYLALANAVRPLRAEVNLALDLSHLGIDVDPIGCREHLVRIAGELDSGSVVQVGAEDSSRTDAILDCVVAAKAAGAAVAGTLQANLRRSRDDAQRLADAGVPVRLVKGAYVEPTSIAHPYGEETDAAFARLAQQLHEAGAALALATHDRVLRAALLPGLPDAGVEQLLGVRPADAEELVRQGRRVRVYVPYGEGWFRYWMRRVAEAQGT